jgi:hypothetical protein
MYTVSGLDLLPRPRNSLLRRQRFILAALCAVLMFVVFNPLVETLALSAYRGGKIKTDLFEVLTPHTWRAELPRYRVIEIWSPCKTVFCSLPGSSIRVYFEANLIGRREEWYSLALKHLQARGSEVEKALPIHTAYGDAECVQSHGKSDPNYVESLCLVEPKGLMAAFSGNIRDIEIYRSIVSSIRFRN